MMKRFIFVTALAVSSVSLATEPWLVNTNTNTNSSDSSTTSTNNNTNATTNNNSSGSTSSSTGVNGNVTSAASSGPSTSNAVATSDSNSAVNANGAGASSNNMSLTQNYQSHRAPVNTAYAASLTSGLDTCLGSASGGVQSSVLGVTLGKTRTDANCVLIKQVQLLQQLGFPSAACYRARAGKEGHEIDSALRAAGVDCATVGLPPPAPAALSAPAPTPYDAVRREELAPYVTKDELSEHERRILNGVLRK